MKQLQRTSRKPRIYNGPLANAKFAIAVAEALVLNLGGQQRTDVEVHSLWPFGYQCIVGTDIDNVFVFRISFDGKLVYYSQRTCVGFDKNGNILYS